MLFEIEMEVMVMDFFGNIYLVFVVLVVVVFVLGGEDFVFVLWKFSRLFVWEDIGGWIMLVVCFCLVMLVSLLFVLLD